MNIKEDLLHYVWRTKQFDVKELKTKDGQIIDIQDFGQHNFNAGPDFLNARILIGTTLWIGNVEMHINTSDWYKHQHHKDKAYENVILHVVYQDDTPEDAKADNIPRLELQHRIAPKMVYSYQQLLDNTHWIPCQARFHEISALTKTLWLERLLIERLERKTKSMETVLAANQNNWEEVFYQFLARSFGLQVNAEPFEWLAQKTPLKLLLKHKDQLFQIEALLFGQSGLLEKEYTDEYPRQLKQEYQFLKHKYQLQPLSSTVWKFMRLHPPNFPTIRLAQLAKLIYQSNHLFSTILKAQSYQTIQQLFQVQPSDYWLTHYTFDKLADMRKKPLGKQTIDLLIINTIAPFLFLYGIQRAIPSMKDTAIQLLERTPPEKNNITKQWQTLNIPNASAYESQALIQLKKEYCDPKRCLECTIGHALLRL